MSCAVEERINRMQGVNALVQDTKRAMVKADGRPKLNNDEPKSSLTEFFPWVSEFRKMCRCVHTDKSMTSLTELMQFYVRNVSISVNECYTRPLRVARLRDSISETLLLFLYIYRELSEDRDRSIYLNNMSDLLALYVDMELKASKKSKEEHDKICARLTSCLYVYLEHSTEHLLDTLMKIQFMCRNYHHILDPIITKIIKNIPAHPESNAMYVRYFLIYRLWRKINGDAAVKNQITTAAIVSLGPPPSAFPPCVLKDVLPKCQPNSAKILLQHKFNIKRCCELFVQSCRGTIGSICQELDGDASPNDTSSKINSQMSEDITSKTIERVDNNINSIKTEKKPNKRNESISLRNTNNTFKSTNLEDETSFKRLATFSNDISTNSTIPKSNRKLARRKFKKNPNEILIIDLTSDVALEKCIKKRKSRKLAWLEEAKKSIDPKMLRASRKIKKSKQEKISSRSSHAPKNSSRQPEDPQPAHVAEANNLKAACDDSASRTGNSTTDNKKTNIKEACASSSPAYTDKPLSAEFPSSAEQIPDTSGVCGASANPDDRLDDRLKRTVIKRLIETDSFSERLNRERVESLKKSCDSATERPNSVASAISNDYSKEDNSNLNVTKGKVFQSVPAVAQSGQTAASVKPSNGVRAEHCRAEVRPGKAGTPVVAEVSSPDSFTGERTASKKGKEFPAERSARSAIPSESPKDPHPVTSAGKEPLVEPTVDNYVASKAEDTCKRKSSDADTRESIFDAYSTDKRDISSEFKRVTVRNEGQEVSSNDRKFKKPVNVGRPTNNDSKNELQDGKRYSETNGNIPRTDQPEQSDSFSNKSLKNTCDKVILDASVNKFDVQSAELQDSIDGLSLLASVSQHVPHLKAEFGAKCEQIKVKDYASLGYACYGQPTDDETDTNDSSNTVSQLLENPSAEIINRIVGIYPEEALDQIALQVEVTSSNAGSDVDSCKIVAHPEPNYGTDGLTHCSAAESNAQPAKENTNVILNGETVVLLQKSPNSNLYIINKAVENLKDCNDDDVARLKEKSWLPLPVECGQFELVTSGEHASFNLELAQYKELPYQETKFIGRSGIKLEPDDANLPEYPKKLPLPDILPATQLFQDANGSLNKSDKRKSKNLPYRPNIKQEFNTIPNHIAANCGIQGCNGIHEVVDAQHPLHIPVTRATTLPPIYGNCAATSDLCVPYHKHCTSVSCSLQINATTSLHSHGKAASPCGRSHCSCLNCTYDIVTHCRQCIHPATDTHVSCIESNPYFLPAHSSVQTPAVQEHDRTKSDAVIGKLYDDQLLCKIEKSLLQNSPLEKLDAQQRDQEKLYKKNIDNKLPLKKRLKAHAMMSAFDEMPFKAEQLGNYPGIPMMSIAALEALDGTQKRAQIVKAEYELSSNKEDPRAGYLFNSNLLRRDYYKDVHVSSSHHSLAKESTRKHDRQFRSANDQPSNTVCEESRLQRTFKTAAQRKETSASGGSLKRFQAESIGQGPYKKPEKTQSPIRKTRSSKRNVPKVNYCYTDVDPEWNPSGESKRKRKKTSR